MEDIVVTTNHQVLKENPGAFKGTVVNRICSFINKCTNRLSSTIDGNRKIDQLRTTSYVSNEKRKTTCPLISWYDFQDSVEINDIFVGIREKIFTIQNQIEYFYCHLVD